MEKYRSVLSVEGALRLFATALLGRLPQGMSSLAILLVVRGATHSYAAAGLATGGNALASAVAAPLQGRLVDRLGSPRVLVPCAVAQAFALLGLIGAASAALGAAVLVALSSMAGALQPALAPAVRALLRELVPDPEVRETAYALEAVTQELIWIAGPMVVAVIIAAASPRAAIVASCLACVTGSALFVSTPAVRSRRRSPSRHGAGVLRATPGLRALLVPLALMGIALGATEVGLPSVALHAGSRASSGLLLAMWSAGSLVGGLLYGARRWRLTLHRRLRRLFVAAVVCALPLLGARTILEGLIGALLAGLTISPAFSCVYALAGQLVTAGGETEAFTWVAAALVGGVAAGSALGGAVIATAGVSGPFVIACLALAGAALCAARLPIVVPATA